MQFEDVLTFWFGNDPETPWANAPMWFEAGRSLDPVVREQFLPTIEAGLRGQLDSWTETPAGTLALIVVLDQFTRHAFRDTPRFVEGDKQAQQLTLGLLDAGAEASLNTAQTMFLLTALEHAEDRAIQERGLAEAKRLGQLHPEDLGGMVQYVQDHHDIVMRFGRLPDRNALLGRPSTPEEQEFLATESRPWFERSVPA